MMLTGPKKLVSKTSRVNDKVSGVVDNSSTAPITAVLIKLDDLTLPQLLPRKR